MIYHFTSLMYSSFNKLQYEESSHSGTDENDSLLNKWLTITKNFISNNNDIIFTRADKGNTTVALDKLDYESKMRNILSDRNTYEIIKRSMP